MVSNGTVQRCTTNGPFEGVNAMGDKNPNKQPKKKKPEVKKAATPAAAPVYSNPDKKPKK
jgi:hypothetical protein